MDELENEMEDISHEQNILTEIVKKNVKDFIKSLKEKQNIDLDRDLANGFITRAIQYNYEKNYFIITPSNVKIRMTEAVLDKKL
jgi:ABC-type siderophore export system fused ATPase/permease subunit